MAFMEGSHPATDFEEMGNVLFHNKQEGRCYLNKEQICFAWAKC